MFVQFDIHQQILGMSTLLVLLQFLLHLPLLYMIPEVLLIPHLLTPLDGLQHILPLHQEYWQFLSLCE